MASLFLEEKNTAMEETNKWDVYNLRKKTYVNTNNLNEVQFVNYV